MTRRCFTVPLFLFLLHCGPAFGKVPPGKKRTAPPSGRFSAARPTPTPKKVDRLQLGPMVFTVTNGKVKSIRQLNAEELLKLAYKNFGQRKYKVAIVLYKRLVKYFPLHKNSFAGLYNLALSYEEVKQYREAIETYRRFVSLYKEKKKLVLNARFRMGSCLGQLKQWSAAFKVYDKILQGELSLSDRYEALAYAGEARFRAGQTSQARPLLALAVRLYDRQPVQKRDVSYAIAMSQYYLARMADLRFRKQDFHFPLQRLKQDLEAKAQLFLRAQRMYLKAVRLGSIDWAMASLYSIGKMYEQLYKDMMKAPYPKDLNKEERAVYTRLLRNRIQNLLRKAMWLYKHSLRVAKRLGIKEGVWTQKAEKSLREVFAFYKKTFGTPHSPSNTGSSSRPASAGSSTTRPVTPPPTSRPAPATRPASR